MCSNAINKSLQTLDFVDNIDADIKSYTFKISFKANSNVDFARIKKKVEDAGFSVSDFLAIIYFDNVEMKTNQPVRIGSSTLLFVNLKDRVLNGEINIKLLDQGFISSKEYRRNPILKSSVDEGIYHVTI